MPNADIRIYTRLEELSRAAAQRFSEVAGASVVRNGTFAVVLSGGSTPKVLYRMLADPGMGIPWSKVQLFQVDERAVPPDDPQSNYRMIRETLLEPAAIPESNFHRIPAEWPDRQKACAWYTEELGGLLDPRQGAWPRFDLVLLGMGADGHTASLFPGTPALRELALWVCENYVESLKAYRLTLTFPVLNAAREVVFLVSGAEKAEALRAVLEGPPQPDKYPAQRVRPQDGHVSWYIDEAAARLLSLEARKSKLEIPKSELAW